VQIVKIFSDGSLISEVSSWSSFIFFIELQLLSFSKSKKNYLLKKEIDSCQVVVASF